MKCAWKSCEIEVSGRRRFCGVKCKRKYFVDARRHKLKQMAIAYMGGRCVRCGYDRCAAALVFRHENPEQKDFSVSVDGITRSWEKTMKELSKCVLLCANCHAEVHHDIE